MAKEEIMDRITLRVERDFKRNVQAEAIRSGTNLTDLVTGLLRDWLAERRQAQASPTQTKN